MGHVLLDGVVDVSSADRAAQNLALKRDDLVLPLAVERRDERTDEVAGIAHLEEAADGVVRRHVPIGELDELRSEVLLDPRDSLDLNDAIRLAQPADNGDEEYRVEAIAPIERTRIGDELEGGEDGLSERCTRHPPGDPKTRTESVGYVKRDRPVGYLGLWSRGENLFASPGDSDHSIDSNDLVRQCMVIIVEVL